MGLQQAVTARIIYNLQPLLQVRDLEATIAFWRDVLGFRVDGLFPEEVPTWCGMHSGNARIMFSTLDGVAAPALTGAIYLYLDDVEATWRRLRDTTEVAEPLHDTAYGMREFSIRDPNGFTLSLGGSSEVQEDAHHREPHES
jgi:uncharacterized glyoxalase superfamily protein PhnB